jgi:hypothetical protein
LRGHIPLKTPLGRQIRDSSVAALPQNDKEKKERKDRGTKSGILLSLTLPQNDKKSTMTEDKKSAEAEGKSSQKIK